MGHATRHGCRGPSVAAAYRGWPMAHLGAERAAFAAAVAGGKSVTDAAVEAGVSRRTATRWFGEDDVRAEVERLRRSTLSHARERLLGLVDSAADALAEVLAGVSASAPRVAAARTVFASALRLDERTELEERLRRVEEAIEIQQAAQQRRWPA